MIKVIVNITKAIVAIVVSLFFSSCDFGLKGSGNVTTENRTVTGDFSTVNVDDGMEVVIEQGSQRAITVEADDNLQKHIKTEVKNGELYISTDENINGAKAMKITVRLANIKGISSDGGSSVKSSGMLKGDSIDISSDGGSSVEVRVEAKNLNCDASSGSSLAITGTTQNVEADASSGSSIEADKLTAQNVRADASSGSSISVNPIDKLVADASSGSSIYYVGTPSKMEKKSDSGGTVAQK